MSTVELYRQIRPAAGCSLDSLADEIKELADGVAFDHSPASALARERISRAAAAIERGIEQ